MGNEKNLYTKDSIESLNPLQFTRLKPGVYCGSTEYSTQLLVEIISNSIDEFRLGHGEVINVNINGDIIEVEDFGQGFIPNSVRDDGKTILEAAFSVLNTSGKYREDGTYEGTSLGSFGIGSKLSNFLSNWLEVKTYRDKQFEFIRFKEGEFESRESGKWTNPDVPSGTVVKWKPSAEFFTHTTVEVKKVKDLFKTTACLCPGLKINLNIDGELTTYFSSNGLNDLVDEQIKNKEIIDNRLIIKDNDGKNKIDFILSYTSNYSSTIVPYVNTGLTDRGPHITQIKTLITREFNKYFREKQWLKEKDENLSGDDIQEGMYIAFNLIAPNVAYDAQVKTTITKIDMTPFNSFIIEALHFWFATNEKEVKIIADKALRARKAREAAKKARDSIREQQQKKKEKVIKFDSKLADCYSKDRTKCEIYITEGDSASGNLKDARDNEFQAIMPIRGKILNVRKATLEKIQKNSEIMTMIDAFGLIVDQKTMKLTYNKEDLRYGKIIIMSDADVNTSAYERLFA